MSEAADALAASALVLAILAALFSVWMPDISAELVAKLSDDKANNAAPKRRLGLILRTRLYPLLAAALVTAGVLTPRCYGILISPITCSPRSMCHYDDVEALMLLTFVLLILLCIALGMQVHAVRSRRRDCDHPGRA